MINYCGPRNIESYLVVGPYLEKQQKEKNRTKHHYLCNSLDTKGRGCKFQTDSLSQMRTHLNRQKHDLRKLPKPIAPNVEYQRKESCFELEDVSFLCREWEDFTLEDNI
jgi:hypothetical protein